MRATCCFLALACAAGVLSAQDDIFAQPVLGFIPKPGWPPAGPVPRLADGKPDLSGPWAPNALRLNNNTDSVIKDIPMQPWVADILKQRRAGIGKDDPEGLCLPPGPVRTNTTPFPFRIVQSPGLIVIIYEGGAHLWRQVFIDGRGHPKDPNPTWLGDSIGNWDGDTLVIDSVGFNGKAWLDAAGLPTTEKLHLTERIRRIDKGHLEIEHTIDDPGAYTKPWKVTIKPVLLDGELMEYICQENNADVKHLVGK